MATLAGHQMHLPSSLYPPIHLACTRVPHLLNKPRRTIFKFAIVFVQTEPSHILSSDLYPIATISTQSANFVTLKIKSGP